MAVSRVLRVTLPLSLCLLLVAAAVSAQAVKQNASATQEAGFDRPGYDLPEMPIVMPAPPKGSLDVRVQECEAECGKNPACLAWVYVRPNTMQGPSGNCWLKGAVPNKVSNKSCVAGVLVEWDTDRPGGDLPGTPIESATARSCQDLCYKNNDCTAWTFVKPNTIQGPKGKCWLKKTVPAAAKNGCCISGQFKTVVVK